MLKSVKRNAVAPARPASFLTLNIIPRSRPEAVHLGQRRQRQGMRDYSMGQFLSALDLILSAARLRVPDPFNHFLFWK